MSFERMARLEKNKSFKVIFSRCPLEPALEDERGDALTWTPSSPGPGQKTNKQTNKQIHKQTTQQSHKQTPRLGMFTQSEKLVSEISCVGKKRVGPTLALGQYQ